MHMLTVAANASMLLAMDPSDYAEDVATEVRAEMGRQRKTKKELAEVLNITPATAATRLSGSVPLDTRELFAVAAWLGVPPTQFMRPIPQAKASA